MDIKLKNLLLLSLFLFGTITTHSHECNHDKHQEGVSESVDIKAVGEMAMKSNRRMLAGATWHNIRIELDTESKENW